MKTSKKTQKKNDYGFLFLAAYLLQKYFTYFRELFQSVHIESKLAYASTIRIIKITITMCFFLGITWIMILFTLYQYLIEHHYPLLDACASLIALNLGCLITLYFYARYLKKNLSFNATKNQIKKIVS